MALSKIAIIALASVGTIGVAGAITGGVIAANNRSDSDGNKQEMPQQPVVITKEKLDILVKGITKENIVLLSKQEHKETGAVINTKSLVETTNNTAIKLSDVFAFDANNYNFVLDETTTKTLGKDVKVAIQVDEKSAMNLADLNNGKLSLKLQASVNESTKSDEVKLEVDTFKKPSAELVKLFGENANSAFELPVLSELNTDTKYLTIEQLNTTKQGVETDANNKETTLSDLYKNTLKMPQNDGLKKETIKLEGQVKLEKITKEGMNTEAKTYFYLTSADSSFLKLSATSTKEEASSILVSKIKLNNLAVSSISVVPNGNTNEENENYLKSLKAKWNGDDMPAENLTVTVKGSDSREMPENNVSLPVVAYGVKKADSSQTTTNASLLVSFGTKTYSTTVEGEMKELKDAGFSFGVFSKDLMNDASMPINAAKVTHDDNKLNTYFTKNSSSKPGMKPTAASMQTASQTGGYYLYYLDGDKFTKEFQLGKNEPVTTVARGSVRAITDDPAQAQQMLTNQNWLVFANYSYPNMKQMSMDKVLYVPSLTLIHVEIPAKVN